MLTGPLVFLGWSVGGGQTEPICTGRLPFIAPLSLIFNPQKCTWSVTQQSIRLSQASDPTRDHQPDFHSPTSHLGEPEDTGGGGVSCDRISAFRCLYHHLWSH